MIRTYSDVSGGNTWDLIVIYESELIPLLQNYHSVSAGYPNTDAYTQIPYQKYVHDLPNQLTLGIQHKHNQSVCLKTQTDSLEYYEHIITRPWSNDTSAFDGWRIATEVLTSPPPALAFHRPNGKYFTFLCFLASILVYFPFYDFTHVISSEMSILTWFTINTISRDVINLSRYNLLWSHYVSFTE